MRLDFSGGLVTGVDDLERQLRDAVKSTFEARAAAYDEEVRNNIFRRAEFQDCFYGGHRLLFLLDLPDTKQNVSGIHSTC